MKVKTHISTLDCLLIRLGVIRGSKSVRSKEVCDGTHWILSWQISNAIKFNGGGEFYFLMVLFESKKIGARRNFYFTPFFIAIFIQDSINLIC